MPFQEKIERATTHKQATFDSIANDLETTHILWFNVIIRAIGWDLETLPARGATKFSNKFVCKGIEVGFVSANNNTIGSMLSSSVACR